MFFGDATDATDNFNSTREKIWIDTKFCIKRKNNSSDVRILLWQCCALTVSRFTVIIVCCVICYKCGRLAVSRFTVSDQFLTKA